MATKILPVVISLWAICGLLTIVPVIGMDSDTADSDIAFIKMALKIYGGKNDDRGAHPWQALILTKDTREMMNLCGGTLIHRKWVLTAASCFSPLGKTKIFFGVYNKTNKFEAGRSEHMPGRKVFHPCYTKSEKLNGYNLAMLELQNPERVYDPVCLEGPSNSDWTILRNNGKISGCVATGYGVTDNGAPAEILQQVKFSTVSHKSCVRAYGSYVTKNHICAYDVVKSNEDSCKGDMGGPLVCPTEQRGCKGMYLAGITLAGTSHCGVIGKPGIYTAIAPHLSWIKSIIKGIPSKAYICKPVLQKCGPECALFLRSFNFTPYIGRKVPNQSQPYEERRLTQTVEDPANEEVESFKAGKPMLNANEQFTSSDASLPNGAYSDISHENNVHDTSDETYSDSAVEGVTGTQPTLTNV